MSPITIFLGRLGNHGRDTCKPGEAKALLDAIHVLIEASYWIWSEAIRVDTPTGRQTQSYQETGRFQLSALPKAEAAYALMSSPLSFLDALKRADETGLMSFTQNDWEPDTFDYVQGQITDELRYFAKTHQTGPAARLILDEIEDSE